MSALEQVERAASQPAMHDVTGPAAQFPVAAHAGPHGSFVTVLVVLVVWVFVVLLIVPVVPAPEPSRRLRHPGCR